MRLLVKAVCLASLAAAGSAAAQVTATDLQVAARALSFMENPLTGIVRVGILHSPGNARSLQEAERLRGLLGNGLRVGSLELRPVMVTAANARAANVDLFFLTESTTTVDAHLAQPGTHESVPCVTTDLEQVRNGTCLMGIRSRPKVEIIVNRAAADASGVRFATVFRVMITEI
jgi:ABC-type uncharacterized transport system substrate-binding protein